MALVPLAEIPDGTWLGVDPGTKTLGLAAGSVETGIASPVSVIQRTKFRQDAAALLNAYHDRSCAGLIIGLPVNLDGSQGPRVQSVQAFVRNLLGVEDLPVAFWDERLSTHAAQRSLIALDTSRAKRASIIDAHAAAFILQGALDHRRLNRRT